MTRTICLAMQVAAQKANEISRKNAIEKYYANPKHCLFCGKMMQIQLDGIKIGRQLGEIRRKKFCDHHCAALYTNPKRKKLIIEKEKWRPVLDIVTKEILLSGRGLFHTKVAITAHAKRVIKNADIIKQCAVCGYNKSVEVCHKIPIFKFPSTATIAEINSPSNLIYLCRNHHWEMDHGQLDSEIVQIGKDTGL
jgi:hypothetical protein